MLCPSDASMYMEYTTKIDNRSYRFKAGMVRERHGCMQGNEFRTARTTLDLPHEHLFVYYPSRLGAFIRLYRLSVVLELVYPVPSLKAVPR
jgi:hypothetical protein